MVLAPTPDRVLLVGCVPLNNADEVFRTVTAVLGDRLRRVPDGETGDRRHWVAWQQPVFAHHPDLEPASELAVAIMSGPRMRTISSGSAITWIRVVFCSVSDTDTDTVFARLKAEGVIPAGVRFQVSLPTPIHPLLMFVTPRQRPILLAPYEAALLRELEQILTAIPGDQLAIQWDAPHEVRTWAGNVGDRVPPSMLARFWSASSA